MIPFTPEYETNKATRMVTLLSRHTDSTRDSFLVPWSRELFVHFAARLAAVA